MSLLCFRCVVLIVLITFLINNQADYWKGNQGGLKFRETENLRQFECVWKISKHGLCSRSLYTFNHYIYWFNCTRVLICIISKLSKRNLHNFPSNLLDSKRTDVSSGIITQIFVYRDFKLLTIRYNINLTCLLLCRQRYLIGRKYISAHRSFIHLDWSIEISTRYIIIIVSSSSTLTTTTIFVSFWRKLHFFTLMRFTFICKLFLTSKNVVGSYVCVYVSLYLCVRCRYTRKKWNNFCYLCTKSTSFLFSLPSFFFLLEFSRLLR